MALATAAAATAATTVTMIITVVMVVTMTSTTTATAMAVFMIVIVVVTMIVATATLTVNVTMGQLFGSGSAHVLDLYLEAQGDASQRMVAIHFDELFRDFNHSHRTVTIIGFSHKSIPFGNFHTVEQLARYLFR